MNEKNLRPDRDAIAAHLNFLFSDVQEFKDGKIEIAYTPADSGAVSKAEWFSVSDLGIAADFAARINSTPGVNVYVGAAIRDPETPPFGRSEASDYYASTVIWCDLDDPGAAVSAKEIYRGLPPSFVVVTGREPNLRAQVWWKLMHPETDPASLRQNLAHICSALNGDRAVVDHARVMRLGGTVAWPKKEGRIPELTEIKKPDNATVMVMSERFKDYFPNAAPLLTTTAAYGGVGIDGKPRNPITGRLRYSELLEATRTPGHWHSNMRDAVASMISSNWSDEQIRLACGPYCNAGPHDPDLNVLIGTGRNKWKKPDPETLISPDQYDPDTGEIRGIEAIDIADIDLDHIPPRAWLFGDIVARKYVSMIAASPGAGKSVFTMQMAICASAGKSFGPYKSHEPSIRTWVYNNEEGEEELRRRVAAMVSHEEIDKAALSGKFFMNSGERQSICIARKNIDGGVLHTPDYEQLKSEIIRKKIDLLIVDPFAETHDVNENSNDEIKTVAGLYRRIAIECNCAVLLVHHTRKGGNASEKSNEQNSNADSARGGGAQIGVVRRMFTLAKMDSGTAAKLNVPDNQRYWFIRFDDAKTNITAPSQDAQWFKFQSIALNNGTGLYKEGDKVGVLCHKTIEEIQSSGVDEMKSDRVVLLSRIASIMINSGVDEIRLSQLLELIKNSGYVKYKDRALRNFIEDTICYKSQNQPVICNGYRCVMKYIEGKTRQEGHKIVLQKEVVND